MRIILLGTGFAIPSPKRAQSGILVETRENLILLDCGSGVLRRLSQSGIEHMKISCIFFTHHHLDHDSDFLPLIKANYLSGRKDMKIFGPMGTREWTNAQLKSYPYLEGRFELEIKELQKNDNATIGRDSVKTMPVKHIKSSLAYRIDSKDSSVVYSGDSEPCKGIRDLIGSGVDLLIHECSVLESSREKKGHTTPEKLGEFIRGLNIKKLVLTHFSPDMEGHEFEIVKIISDRYGGEIVVGEDLLRVDV
jgi:ribonuclease BN (tRNA processing enzyme)